MNKGEFGHSRVLKSGYVDLPKFLATAKEYFKRIGCYDQETMEEEGFTDKYPNYLVIDCRGYKSAFSPWWSFLLFGLTKGELLTIKCPNFPLTDIFNAGFFVCPLGDDIFRVGATFNWDDTDTIPTEIAKSELIDKLNKWIDRPYEILDHRAGVRPTVDDRRPLFGVHPSIANLYLFNGLGAKGVMLAPHLSNIFLDFVLHDVSLPPDIDLARYLETGN